MKTGFGKVTVRPRQHSRLHMYECTTSTSRLYECYPARRSEWTGRGSARLHSQFMMNLGRRVGAAS
eukprot:4443175-Prymnesium_polylepis.1